MSKQLIVNADDFGLSKGVNQGIMEAHLNGVISSASLMVNMPGFEDAVAWAKKVPSLGVGFHFNLSYGKPLSPLHEVPSLVDEQGHFHKMKLSNPPTWNAEDVEKELRQQWRRLKETELSVTHLDSHHYIQRISSVYPAYAELAHEEGLPMRHTFQFPEGHNYDDHKPVFSQKCQLPKKHPPTTDAFIGDVYFQDDSLKRLHQHLSMLQDGLTELNCHPGYVDEELKTLSAWTTYREREFHTLTHVQTKRLMKEYNIHLVTFSSVNEEIHIPS